MLTEAEALRRFAANLKSQRERVGLSQEALGFEAGLHRTAVSLLERCGREPRLWTLVRLAQALDIGLGELLDGIDNRP